MEKNKHIFALYFEALSEKISQPDDIFVCKDKELYNRVTKILRLQKQELLTLFDKKNNITIELSPEMFSKKNHIIGTILKKEINQALAPEVILCPALLQKHFFEDAVYVAAQMGANKIIPVMTEKVKRSWLKEKDHDRLKKIMVSACEQSKQFVLPQLDSPISFAHFLQNTKNNTNVFFDAHANPLLDMLKNLKKENPQKIVLFFGPEGGLTPDEKEQLNNHDFTFCTLTPTILRAIEAIKVGLGSVRSLWH